ncbi:MAG: RsmD family RNA methyltransferase [Thermoguttaceae bacterium]|nr:RsmD family RNA methyltransferase [Thermoguttaceae bacterium]MBQ6619256.1 RsmD family RNA methyltransferase [Thermoguttaceae bacterium]
MTAKKNSPSGGGRHGGKNDGRPRPQVDRDLDPESSPKRVYSDLYVVGKAQRSFEPRTREERKKLRGAGAPSITPMMDADEFLREYAKVYPHGENTPAKPGTAAAKGKGKAKGKTADAEVPRRGKNVGSQPGPRGKVEGLRIIGGKFRGTKLAYSGDHRVRPMKDRIRESVFNLIGPMAVGKHAVDLFAGTGALAFEAISRGALSATVIEVHFPTARVLKQNIALLEEKMPGISQMIDVKTNDTFLWGRGDKSIAEMRRDIPWLVFCSPPYDFYVERTDEMLRVINNLTRLAPDGSVFVIESDDRFNFDLLGVDIPKRKRRSYYPAEIAVYTVPDHLRR